MKRILAGLTACLAMALMAVPASAQARPIDGSAHDFSSATWNASGEICVVCHTPHNADATVADSPLWNHEVTDQPNQGGYTVYTNPATMTAVPGQPTGESLLCLSCHDGTVALDNFGGLTTGTQVMDSINSARNLGSDLSNDHPVSFAYTDALAGTDGELELPGSTPAVAALLFSGSLECASCHDVHNTTGFASLLRVDNTGSGLCQTCHIK